MSNPDQSPAILDANALEAMARERPDDKFLKGSGVLKLTGAIRTLEREVRELREAAAMAATVPGYIQPSLKSVLDYALMGYMAMEATGLVVTADYRNEAIRRLRAAIETIPQAPVAGQPAVADAIVGWEIEYEHFGPALTVHKARADEALRLGFTVHALGRLAAPKGDSNG